MIVAARVVYRDAFLEKRKRPLSGRDCQAPSAFTWRVRVLLSLIKNRRFSNVKIPLDSYRLFFDKNRHEFPAVNLNRRSGDRVNKRESSGDREKSPKGGRAAVPRQASPRPERPARPLAPRRRVTSMFPEEEEMPPPSEDRKRFFGADSVPSREGLGEGVGEVVAGAE